MFNRTAIRLLAALVLLTPVVLLVGAVAATPGISWT
jgi:hypothetical protein